MPIERSFEALTPVPPEEVYEVFSDLESHIPLWSTYESIRMVSENEAEVALRISGNVYNLKAKLATEERRGSKVVTVECRGQIYLHLRLVIEPRGIGSLVSGRLYFKAGFLRERILSPAIASFIEDLKNKIMFQLPSIAEVIRRRKEARVVKPPEAPTGRESVEVKPTQGVGPSPQPPAELAEVKPRGEERGEELRIKENPDSLTDAVAVGMILLKSELTAVESFEGGWEEIKSLLRKYVKELKGANIYVRIKAEGADVKVLMRKGVVEGLRVETGKETLNGDEAISKVKELKKLKGRAYVFKIPETG